MSDTMFLLLPMLVVTVFFTILIAAYVTAGAYEAKLAVDNLAVG